MLFYHAQLKKLNESLKTQELKNLGHCENGVDSSSKFSSEELNANFSHVSFDAQALSTTDYLEGLNIPEDFPRFSLS